MDGAGNDFLAGTGLSKYEYTGFRRRHLIDPLHDSLQPLVSTDDALCNGWLGGIAVSAVPGWLHGRNCPSLVSSPAACYPFFADRKQYTSNKAR
ncbi:hypothetical protein GCM10027297_16300 [Parahaliea aestuarii]